MNPINTNWYYQAAKNVSWLLLQPSLSYIKPGTFLLSHPLLDGFFDQTVICLLNVENHEEENQNKCTSCYSMATNKYANPRIGQNIFFKNLYIFF